MSDVSAELLILLVVPGSQKLFTQWAAFLSPTAMTPNIAPTPSPTTPPAPRTHPTVLSVLAEPPESVGASTTASGGWLGDAEADVSGVGAAAGALGRVDAGTGTDADPSTTATD
jgi:hypothetical protein